MMPLLLYHMDVTCGVRQVNWCMGERLRGVHNHSKQRT